MSQKIHVVKKKFTVFSQLSKQMIRPSASLWEESDDHSRWLRGRGLCGRSGHVWTSGSLWTKATRGSW